MTCAARTGHSGRAGPREVAWVWRTLTLLGRVAVAAAGALAVAAVYGGIRLDGRGRR